jgi:hypothetical protein
MRKSLFGVLTLAVVLALASGASAHIGDTIYLFYEIPDADVADIDLEDANVDDWLDVVGDPSVTALDFAPLAVGDGAGYDPNDMDYQIWFGWNESTGTVWGAMERSDDVYVNEYEGGNTGDFWRWDSCIELMLDGDHTGGAYADASNCEGCDEEAMNLFDNRQAQQFLTIADSPDDSHIGYHGKAQTWFIYPPYCFGGGGSYGTAPVVSVSEFYVTPMDNLIYNDPEASQASQLFTDKIIGFQISVPDFETGPGAYHAFHTLSGQAQTWQLAERFVDARLVGGSGTGPTAVEENSWGRIKASFGE